MLRTVTSTSKSFTLQALLARKRSLADEIHLLQVNQTIVDLVITACTKNADNEELYKQLLEGFLTEREFIDNLKDVSDALRYQLAMAFLDSHAIAGA